MIAEACGSASFVLLFVGVRIVPLCTFPMAQWGKHGSWEGGWSDDRDWGDRRSNRRLKVNTTDNGKSYDYVTYIGGLGKKVLPVEERAKAICHDTDVPCIELAKFPSLALDCIIFKLGRLQPDTAVRSLSTDPLTFRNEMQRVFERFAAKSQQKGKPSPDLSAIVTEYEDNIEQLYIDAVTYHNCLLD